MTRYSEVLSHEVDAYLAFWTEARGGREEAAEGRGGAMDEREPRWAVIESTPGYLPEEDEPVIFDDLDEAINYAKEQTIAAALDIYGDPSMACQTSERSWYVCSTDPHDLGRMIEVVRIEEES